MGKSLFLNIGMSNCSFSGGCIDHAHIHAIPCSLDFRSHLQLDFPEVKINDLNALSMFAKANISYIFYEDSFKNKFVYIATEKTQSQYLRRLWARLTGKPKEWNWGVFIGQENIAQTIEQMHQDLYE